MEKIGLYSEWSPRTFTRYVQAMEMQREACDKEETAQFIKSALRPNGKLKVSRLLEIAFKHH